MHFVLILKSYIIFCLILFHLQDTYKHFITILFSKMHNKYRTSNLKFNMRTCNGASRYIKNNGITLKLILKVSV